MCPKPNDTGTVLSTLSHVEDFEEGIPNLFAVLTERPDSLNRWDIKTFPVDIEYSQYAPKKEIKIKMRKLMKTIFIFGSDIFLQFSMIAKILSIPNNE